jgi:acyl-CoA synthetase (AMP-forming)/AMP-acid ligase II
MILSGGENIQPVTVENALLAHPDIVDVAVSGEPDERWGQVVTAYVVRRHESLTETALAEWVKEACPLDPFMRPRRYRFVPEIPRSASGKILRKALPGLLGAQQPSPNP